MFLVLATGYGKINCHTFLGGEGGNQVVGCGFGRSPLISFGKTTEKAFVGYGVLKGVSFKNDKILLKVMIPWGGVFSFLANVELDKRPDRKYNICQEKHI